MTKISYINTTCSSESSNGTTCWSEMAWNTYYEIH